MAASDFESLSGKFRYRNQTNIMLLSSVAILGGGAGWSMAPQIFACPPSFFLDFTFKFVWLTYAGLPNAFCKNTGHFVNSARSELCRNS